MRRYRVWLAVGGLAALLGVPVSLQAQGYSVNEHGTCTMARGGTATASPCADGSAMFYNPAGLAGLGKGHGVISAGGTGILATGGFENDFGPKDDLKKKLIPVPHVYAAYGISDKIAAGISLFAPYGLETNWQEDSQARFLGYRSVIRNVYIQPTLAIRLHPRVDFGAGFDYNFSHVQLRQHVDLSSQAIPVPFRTAPTVDTFYKAGVPVGTDFADVNLHGNGHSVGYHLGLIVRPVDRLSLGVRYLSRQLTKIEDATAEFRQINTGIILGGAPLDALLASQFTTGGDLVTQSANTYLRLPEQLSFGAAVDVTSKFRALVDVVTTNWKVFDTLFINLEHAGQTTLPLDDERSWAFRLGGEYAVSPSTTFRAGYINHGPAAPDQSVIPNLPEGPRAEFTGGLGTKLGQNLQVNLAYQYIKQQKRRGRVVPDPTVTNGLYTFNAHLFGATFTYTF
jgi:long-chain fatty acid transport protein